MDPPPKPTPSHTGAFQVYLRLRPPLHPTLDAQQHPERCLTVEPPETLASLKASAASTHITLHPPADSRKRAVEKFAFTKIFEEDATQLDVFEEIGMVPTIRGVLGEGRDGLIATLGVTGSGKSHTILGSKAQRGITQMTLDVLFKSLAGCIQPSTDPFLLASIASADPSEAQLLSAGTFIESVFGDNDRGRNSRAQTPMTVGSRAQTPLVGYPPHQPEEEQLQVSPMSSPLQILHPSSLGLYPKMLGLGTGSPERNPKEPEPKSKRSIAVYQDKAHPNTSMTSPSKAGQQDTTFSFIPQLSLWNPTSRITRAAAKLRFTHIKDSVPIANLPQRRNLLQRPSALPQFPDVSDLAIPVESGSQYAIVVSMYEVYNDRIFDLLTSSGPPRPSAKNPSQGRRALLFKPTEASPDRKVVAGLRKIVCATYDEALMVLETGLTERKVTGTGSNSVSSRSHGFFCLEVKQRIPSSRYGQDEWKSTNLTIVDLAGSERARNAKTAGATLAEAGKINESLMYLGQCLQMQIDCHEGAKPNLVPFRQCKLTELLFSNSFPQHGHQRVGPPPQKAIMIVTADPLGDYNATSQILRYSALAREVTVPRIPSVSSQILSGTIRAPNPNPGRVTPTQTISAEELDLAISEIKRLNEQVEFFAIRLAEEEIRRENVEMELQVALDRCEEIEVKVREELWAETEEALEQEKLRWKKALDEERGRGEMHLDAKLELLGRGVDILEDPAEERCEQLEFENDALHKKLEALERQLENRSSPTKKSRSRKILGENTDVTSPSGSPAKVSRPPAFKLSPKNMSSKSTLVSDENAHPNKEIDAATKALSSLSFEHQDSSDDVASVKSKQQQDGMTLHLGDSNKTAIDSEVFKLKPKLKTPMKPKITPDGVPSSGRKIRKLTARKWDLAPEEDLDGF